jgi:TPP-dependent pyruvate/acetoin dehydrogenase alpha subunit
VSEPTLDDWKTMYGALLRIRLFEGQVQRLAGLGEIPGFPHLSTGQEAVAVGICTQLEREDVLFTSHRGHGHVLAKGSDIEATFAEILGRQTGLCGGRGGSMHLVDAENGVLGATGVVAGNLALAAGAAWALQALGRQNISVVFFGDGATGAGAFHETLNLAALWRLPVLFVCENNGYAEFTSREEHSNVKHVSSFAAPYAIATQTIDGNDLPGVFSAARHAIEAVRGGAGPYLLECMTFRMAGHYVGDSQQYRSKEDLAAIREKCPIERFRRYLLERGVTQDSLDAIDERTTRAVLEAVKHALEAPRPDPATAFDFVYRAPELAAIPG